MPNYKFNMLEAGLNPDNASKDWTATNRFFDTEDIKKIQIDVAVSRLGSSIPSPFARMFLFKNAFEAIPYNGDGVTPFTPPFDALGNRDYKLYLQIISDCFDMLELIFSNPESITFVRYDIGQQIRNLDNSSCKEHRRLSNVLTKEFEVVRRPKADVDISDLYLVFYNHREIINGAPKDIKLLVGVTSPFTLVYTSPNLRTAMELYGIRINGMIMEDGSRRLLFSDDYSSLHRRNGHFCDYLYALQHNYGVSSDYLTSIWNYIRSSRDVNNGNGAFDVGAWTSETLAEKFNIHHIDNIYTVSIGEVPIYSLKIESIVEKAKRSHLRLKPDVDFYTARGSFIPILLTPTANEFTYVETKWGGSNTLGAEVHEINSRTLPNYPNCYYPYIRFQDIFFDQLIKLPYVANSGKFKLIELSLGGKREFYLLPIKKEYFEYFELNKLDQRLRVISSAAGTEIRLELTIPIQGNPGNDNASSIICSKSYNQNDIIVLNEGDGNDFHLGVFPFYRMQEVENHTDLYQVFLQTTKKNEYSLKFYRKENMSGGLIIDENDVNTQTVRYSKTYRVSSNGGNQPDGRFDFIEIIRNDHVIGLLAPQFDVVDLNNRMSLAFCVDFGTSNTHIAVHNSTFCFDNEHTQLVTLCAELPEAVKANINRELLPQYIGNGDFKFPVRTATNEAIRAIDGNFYFSKLFAKINIGFTLLDESAPTRNDMTFSTDIKWGIDLSVQERVQSYFHELAWMIKNYSILNGANLNPKVILTFPLAMDDTRAFVDYWETAFQNVGLTPVIDSSLKESVAPYYAAIMGRENAEETYVNVDIGGGTTDILFHYKRANFATSVRFAGNDLWGDGIPILSAIEGSRPRKAINGFCKLLEKKIQFANGDSKMELLKRLKDERINRQLTSADVMSFWFKQQNTTTVLKNTGNHGNHKLKALICLHYAALLYYIVDIMKSKRVDMPQHLSFSGMGSMYLNLLDYQSFTKNFLKLCYSKEKAFEIDAINISSVGEQNLKELTAEGGVCYSFAEANAIINVTPYYVSGLASGVSYDELAEKKDEVDKILESFIAKFFSKEMTKYLADYENIGNDFEEMKTDFLEEARVSINSMIAVNKGAANVRDYVLFYAFKNAIYNCSIKWQ